MWGGVGVAIGADADGPTLFLGAAEGVAVIESARQARVAADRAAMPSIGPRVPVATVRSTPGFVPSRFHIPDGYEIDLDRDVPAFAAPVDRDNLVSFEVLDRGVGIFLDYDEESYPIGNGGEVLMLQIERRF